MLQIYNVFPFAYALDTAVAAAATLRQRGAVYRQPKVDRG